MAQVLFLNYFVLLAVGEFYFKIFFLFFFFQLESDYIFYKLWMQMWHFSALSSISAEGEWDHNASCPGGGDTGMRSSRSTGKHYTAVWWGDMQRRNPHLGEWILFTYAAAEQEKKGKTIILIIKVFLFLRRKPERSGNAAKELKEQREKKIHHFSHTVEK